MFTFSVALTKRGIGSENCKNMNATNTHKARTGLAVVQTSRRHRETGLKSIKSVTKRSLTLFALLNNFGELLNQNEDRTRFKSLAKTVN